MAIQTLSYFANAFQILCLVSAHRQAIWPHPPQLPLHSSLLPSQAIAIIKSLQKGLHNPKDERHTSVLRTVLATYGSIADYCSVQDQNKRQRDPGEPAFVQIDMCSMICSFHSRSEVSTLALGTVHPGRNGMGTLWIVAYISYHSIHSRYLGIISSMSRTHVLPSCTTVSASAPYGLRTIAHLPAAFPAD